MNASEFKSRNPRAIAFYVLRHFLTSKTDARDLLDQLLTSNEISNVDARLATELVMGVLRQRRLLNFQIQPFLNTPIQRTDPAMLDVLRLGFYQYFFMKKIPAHALVDECVELAKREISSKSGSFINAVLRNLLRQSPALETPDDPGIAFSHPRWLDELYRRRYGDEDADRCMEWNSRRPDLHLRVNLLKTSAEKLCEVLEANNALILKVGQPTPECVIVEGTLGPLSRYEWFKHGDATVQDAASQLVAHFCDPAPEQRIIDWCAAPGGKATHFAELTGEQAKILALDVDARRVDRINENIERLGLQSVTARHAHPDLIEYLRNEKADLVLVDAPCTGLGTIRRNPDIRWRRRQEEPAQMRRIQTDILSSAAECVRPAGRLVYSVCTFTPDECEGVVQDFLARRSDFSLEKRLYVPEHLEPFIDDEGYLRTFPPDHECDAFFAVGFKREG